MNLKLIPDQRIVLIDANIFIYALNNNSHQCVELLERCSKEEVTGVITTHILAEVMHVLMLTEARDLEIISGANPARQLSQKPHKIKVLYRYESFVRDLLSMGFRLESLEREDFITAMSLQRQFGMLTNDALLVAVGKRLGITSLASADSIFHTIHELLHYAPDDLIGI